MTVHKATWQSIFTQLFNTGGQVALFILTLLFLSPAEVGRVAGIQAYALIVSALGALGFANAIIYYRVTDTQVFNKISKVVLCYSATLGIVFFFAASSVTDCTATGQTFIITLYSLSIAFESYGQICEARLQSAHEFSVVNKIDVFAVTLAGGIINGMILTFWRTGESLALMFLINKVLRSFALSMAWGKCQPRSIITFHGNFRSFYSYAISNGIGRIAFGCFQNLDQAIAASVFTTENLGVYNRLVVGIKMIGNAVSNGFDRVLFPRAVATDKAWCPDKQVCWMMWLAIPAAWLGAYGARKVSMVLTAPTALMWLSELPVFSPLLLCIPLLIVDRLQSVALRVGCLNIHRAIAIACICLLAGAFLVFTPSIEIARLIDLVVFMHIGLVLINEIILRWYRMKKIADIASLGAASLILLVI